MFGDRATLRARKRITSRDLLQIWAILPEVILLRAPSVPFFIIPEQWVEPHVLVRWYETCYNRIVPANLTGYHLALKRQAHS